MIALATDSFTNFTAAPLRLATGFGLLSFLFCLIMFVYVIVSYSMDATVRGWASMIATVLFLGGAQLLCLGLVGEYVGRLYSAVQGRPAYFIGSDTADPASTADPQTPAQVARPRG
jgi:dolichol-phosphate mannosyltransferase